MPQTIFVGLCVAAGICFIAAMIRPSWCLAGVGGLVLSLAVLIGKKG